MSNDLIKREDAIKAVEEGMCTFYDCYAIEKLKEVPSAEPKRGEWVRYMGDIWTCTACGESLICDDIECNNYCPNCGARMKGADDEDN